MFLSKMVCWLAIYSVVFTHKCCVSPSEGLLCAYIIARTFKDVLGRNCLVYYKFRVEIFLYDRTFTKDDTQLFAEKSEIYYLKGQCHQEKTHMPLKVKLASNSFAWNIDWPIAYLILTLLTLLRIGSTLALHPEDVHLR